MSSSSPIADFYRGRSVLVTGATGFMGKVLVEKLLRSCPGISTIYLLIRPKKGNDVRTRLQELTNAPIFDSIRTKQPEGLNKLVPICGDITSPHLGISPSDQKILVETVSVVFHSAATVKFDEALKLSVAMNILGTKTLVELCKKMQKIEAFVHVSTAYCNCTRQEINEMVYPPPADPEKIVQCVNWMDESILENITPKLIGDHPNTYTFTKALAEHVLVEQCGNLPAAIVRPSIVSAAWREPLPGWVDNLNGPSGMIAGMGKGILRSMYCHRNLVADFIPVDVATNLMIAVAWHTATSRPNSIMVYNCTSGSINPLFWRNVEDYGFHFVKKHPCSGILWYPGGRTRATRLTNALSVLAFHMVPAYFFDVLAKLTGKKPVMVKIQKKLQRAVSALEFFTTHEFRFSNNNVFELMKLLDENDSKTFNFDINDLDWASHMETFVIGIRKFILKEDAKTFQIAKKHLRKLYYLHVLTQIVLVAAAWKLLTFRWRAAQQGWNALMDWSMRVYRMVPSVGQLL